MATPPVPGEVSRLGPLVDALVGAVLDTPGATTSATRRRARDGTTDEEVVGPYLAKVRRHAYRFADADVEALTAAGLSDDAIFEMTVAAAALGEAQRRLAAGLYLLGR
jgi:alkylhydroperoxidase family enzyme